MQSAGDVLTQEQISQVNQAVEQAQTRTSARIVPLVAGSSGRYERAEDMVGLWAAALGLALIWMLVSDAPVGKEWSLTGNIWQQGLITVVAVIVGGFAAGTFLAGHVAWLGRLFVPKRKMLANVRLRATQVLGNCLMNLPDRDAGQAVVIYVSLYERAPVIAAGENLRAALARSEVQSIESQLRSALLQRRLAEGLCQAVGRLADLLAGHCPPGEAPHRPPQVCLTVLE
jgi:putative membrane protein